MDAIVIGINQSVVLIVQAIAYIMSFIIIMAFINMTLNWFGDRVGIDNLTIEVSFHFRRVCTFSYFFKSLVLHNYA